MIATFTIPGEPTAKGRPRVTRYGTYTPKETVAYENLVKLMYREKYHNKMLEGALMGMVTCYFPVPKSMPKYKRKLVESGQLHPTKKPDCDNLAKAVFDALNGIAYKDDSQIVHMICTKVYTLDEPRVEVTIKEVKED